MPRYRFEFLEDRPVQPVMLDLPDDATAHREAMRTATEIVYRATGNGADPSGWSVTVYGERQSPLFIVKLMDVKLAQ